MPTYTISGLIPLEYPPVRQDSLSFLTQVWRNFGSFDALPNKPHVQSYDGYLCLTDGNHRSIWCALNGIETLDALPDDSLSPSVINKIVKNNSAKGIFSIFDLAKKVKNPSRYSMNGPVTRVITPEQLADSRFFLRV